MTRAKAEASGLRIGLLGNQLQGRPCRGFSSDARVYIEAFDLYTYPDLAIACGELRFQGDRALLNPTLLVEVLFPTTEAYDRGEKFAMYRRLESLQQYVLIAQDRHSVEVFTRQADESGRLQVFSGLEAVASLESIGSELPLSELYAGLELEARSARPTSA